MMLNLNIFFIFYFPSYLVMLSYLVKFHIIDTFWNFEKIILILKEFFCELIKILLDIIYDVIFKYIFYFLFPHLFNTNVLM